MTGVVEIDIKVPSRRKADVITAYLDKEVKQVLEVWASERAAFPEFSGGVFINQGDFVVPDTAPTS
jgi:hypothetical protein